MAYTSKGIESTSAEKAWKQEREAGLGIQEVERSHLSTHRKQ